MQYSIVEKAKLNKDFRIDPEFYKTENLLNDTQIKRHNLIDLQQVFITDGEHGSPEWDENSNIKYITAENIKEGYIQESEFKTISKEQNDRNKRAHLQKDDILIYSVGAYAGLVAKAETHLFPCSIPRSVAIIRVQEKITSDYIVSFLNSKYGKYQMKRLQAGNAQPVLALEKIRDLLIPLMNKELIRIIRKLNKYAYIKRLLVKRIYKKLQNLLIENLDFQEIDTKPKISYIKNFSDTQNANRIDAEYFQPKYDEIINKIKSYPDGWDKFENLIKLRDKNFTPHESEIYDYIELANITKNGNIVNIKKIQGKYLPTRARRKVKEGDVIVSSVEGSLDSIALITSQYDNALCSTGFYVMYSNVYNSETLFCLMKSVLEQFQLKRGCSGTILTAINSDELSKIILPIINQDIQQKIKQYISEMYSNQFLSKQLLEIAKRGVEKAIEESEDIAMQWINEQLKIIGV